MLVNLITNKEHSLCDCKNALAEQVLYIQPAAELSQQRLYNLPMHVG